MERFDFNLYLVTDQHACKGKDLFTVVASAIEGGVDIVQIREKQLTQKDFLYKALKLKEVLDRYSVPLIVNDNLYVAMHCNAAGIHVGNTDISPASIKSNWPDCSIIGHSLEFEDQLQNADTRAADYLALSPVFATATKQDTITVWGLDGLQHIRSLTEKPLVAIGNINASNAAAVMRSGADCLAVVSAICSADHPAKAAAAIRNEIEKGKTART
jgi:thiamine-phosphate pyrophosphorylase